MHQVEAGHDPSLHFPACALILYNQKTDRAKLDGSNAEDMTHSTLSTQL